jgi:hypothetical protein
VTEEGVPLPGTFPAVAPERAPLARAVMADHSNDHAREVVASPFQHEAELASTNEEFDHGRAD